jgi:hypothetical protein
MSEPQNSDEIRLESILPEEAIAKIRKIVADALARPRASIGPSAALSLKAHVYRPRPSAYSESSASAVLRLIPESTVILPSASIWDSLPGSTVVTILVSILIFLSQEYLNNLRSEQSEAFMKALAKEVEELVVAHQDQHPLSVNRDGD